MKKLSALLLITSLFSTSAFAKTGTEGGGGDPTEMRVDEIRSDILKWINLKGPAGLKFTTDVTHEEYVKKMTDILQPQKVIVAFTSDKVLVNNEEKTCKGYVDETFEFHMLCNIARFENTPDAKQYRLIHHEFAGLARVEKNIGAASDYVFSDQITDFLKEERVLRLAIKRSGSEKNFLETDEWRCDKTVEENGVAIKKGKYSVKSSILGIYQPSGALKVDKFSIRTELMENGQFLSQTYADKKNNALDCLLGQGCGKYANYEEGFSSPVPKGDDFVEYVTTVGEKRSIVKCSKIEKTPSPAKAVEVRDLKCSAHIVDADGRKSVLKEFDLLVNDSKKTETYEDVNVNAEIVDNTLVMSIIEGEKEAAALTSPVPTKGTRAEISRPKTKFAWKINFECSLK